MNIVRKLAQMKHDFAYIITNSIVNRIPAWWIRKNIYKLLGMKIGKNSRIGIGTIITYPKQIVIGDRAIINEYCFLDGRGKLYIGNNTSISIYSKFISASHNLNSNDFAYQYKPIVIDDYSFIGAGAIILEGTHLGKGCVIGAGAVAKGEYDNNKMYIGNPAKFVKERECDYSYLLYQNYYFR